MQSAINEGMKSYKDVTSEQIDSKNEGQLIATTGKLDLSNSAELKENKDMLINLAQTILQLRLILD